MKNIKRFVFPFIVAVVLLMNGAWIKEDEKPFLQVRKYVLTEMDGISNELRTCLSSKGKKEKLKSSYLKIRKHYKHIEFFIEYVSPRAAKFFINGPLVPRYDEEQGRRALRPNGLQRMEELLFSDSLPVDTNSFHAECRMLLNVFSQLREYYNNIDLEDGLPLEMCQYELLRLSALNLAGFDSPLLQQNVKETYWCLEGMKTIVSYYRPLTSNGDCENTEKEFSAAQKFLLGNANYASFDRLRFIVRHVNPLNSALVKFHAATGLSWNKSRQPLNLKQGFLFGNEIFSQRWFSVFYEDSVHLDLQARLGEKLFFDPLLSGNNKQSCSGCHNPAKGFTDGLAKSLDIENKKSIARNAPTLINVVYQKSFFADGRVFHLEQQVSEVLGNKDEMRSSIGEVVLKLKADENYRRLFAKAFYGSPDSVITPYAVQKAITEYEKTLVSFSSRFDLYLRGNEQAMTEREINGYNLFEGKALCGSCHFMPLFNGTPPPFYSDSEFEVIGVPATNLNLSPDLDSGRYKITRIPEQLFAFKTPTVRNAELTAPYMHNGVYGTLGEVVDFYNKGGGSGLGLSFPNQTLPFDSLRLSETEKEDLTLFMKALTDPAYVKN